MSMGASSGNQERDVWAELYWLLNCFQKDLNSPVPPTALAFITAMPLPLVEGLMQDTAGAPGSSSSCHHCPLGSGVRVEALGGKDS